MATRHSVCAGFFLLVNMRATPKTGLNEPCRGLVAHRGTLPPAIVQCLIWVMPRASTASWPMLLKSRASSSAPGVIQEPPMAAIFGSAR